MWRQSLDMDRNSIQKIYQRQKPWLETHSKALEQTFLVLREIGSSRKVPNTSTTSDTSTNVANPSGANSVPIGNSRGQRGGRGGTRGRGFKGPRFVGRLSGGSQNPNSQAHAQNQFLNLSRTLKQLISNHNKWSIVNKIML